MKTNIEHGALGSDLPEIGDEELATMTEEELRAHLCARGHDPDKQLAKISASVAELRCQVFLEKVDQDRSAEPSTSDIDHVAIDFHRATFIDTRVSAGRGLGAQDGDASRPVDSADLFGRQNWREATFARVRGNSMAPSGILDGDSILFVRGIEAKDGDVVVAYLPDHGEVVKRLRVDASGPRLESSDPTYPPLRPSSPGELEIRGIVKGRAGPLPE
ncbi:S24 family peptidase [Paucibacter sp. R3-3]|uniref:S24 family peptidase n=1 Tax=Roseateles agri TaxID=3098619 RepID=A0ABU5DNQ7_9BURK|nr:S24 family peptidase [Paucibacter sp. R3-3]MDY0747941.1 S24 family peptidase [Paucibacter sp. R3-3]